MSADNYKDEYNHALAELAIMREQRARDELPSIMTRRNPIAELQRAQDAAFYWHVEWHNLKRAHATEITKLQCNLEAAITECNVLKAVNAELTSDNTSLRQEIARLYVRIDAIMLGNKMKHGPVTYRRVSDVDDLTWVYQDADEYRDGNYTWEPLYTAA